MGSPMFDAGLKVRKEVLGAEYVEQSFASADDFNRPFQEFVTEYCWGGVWTRPGLDRRTRSFLNLGIVAIYCGVPAALDAIRVAREVFKEMGV
jgi:4-carboxymuconolactone decarboxylase